MTTKRRCGEPDTARRRDRRPVTRGTKAYDSGARTAIDVLREWPAQWCDDYDLVPLALWEIDERRRRETVRAVVALLTWGLS